MKKAILIAFAALLSLATFSQDKGVNFTEGTLTELREAAVKAKKLIFVDVYTTWCGPCKYLSNEIFPKETTGKFMNEKFVNAKFDAEKGEGIDIAKAFKVQAYPTMLILNSEGKEVTRIVGGAQTPEAFVKRVEEALAKAK